MVNKIAAGEIIIAPANALKEMLENAIDAGATNIQVTVKDGGMKLLQVTDNGCGIMKDDLPILCHRFTTSKIRKFEDLSSISTYGFRGEALASISHIAHLSVVTKTKDSQCAWKCLYAQGVITPQNPGEKAEPRPTAGKDGTLIIVENLFYNFPSRLKSLKLPNEEYMRILDVVNKYAIHTEKVGFTAKKLGESHNAVTIRDTQSIKDRIRAVYGSSVANNLLEISDSEGDPESGLLGLKGQISNLNYNGNKKKSHVIFFINNRLVDCEPLKKALTSIFAIYLPKGSKPFIYFSLAIKPENLDVNVHPTKKEVRFLHEDEIITFVCHKVQNELGDIDDLREFKTERLAPRSSDLTRSEISFEKADRPPKRQKINLSQSLSSSFSLGSQQPRLDYKNVRVDGFQTKITNFMKQSQKRNSLTEESFDESIQSSPRKGDTTENTSLAIDDSREDGVFTYVPKERTVVSLESIVGLRKKVESNVNKDLTQVFLNFVLVGIVQYLSRLLTIQSDVSLFLVDYGKLFFNLFYQIGLSDFANFGTINLKSPVSISGSISHVQDQVMEIANMSEKTKKEAIAELSDKAEMLEEYFSITLDVSDPEDPKVTGLPLLIKNHIPTLKKLPVFIYKLVFDVDYLDETSCLDAVLRHVANLYVPDSEPSFDSIENGSETEEMEMYKKSVEFLLSVVRRRFLATDDLITSLVEIANLPSLYRCFERC